MPVTIQGTQIVFNDSSTQTTSVLNTMAGATAGGVGTVALLGTTVTTSIAVGGTLAGSSLYYANMWSDQSWSTNGQIGFGVGYGVSAASGTWRCLGVSNRTAAGAQISSNFCGLALWLRIS